MKNECNKIRFPFLVFFLSITFVLSGNAQLIQLKSIPLATGDQFLLFPSERLGMGQVSIALKDRLLDPFVNPAKGSRVEGMQLFGAPNYYSITNRGGSARTLSVGVLYQNKRWFGGFLTSMQELRRADDSDFVRPLEYYPELLSDKSSNNTYFSGYLGKKLIKGIAFAASLFYADLAGLDGVDWLYANSQRVEQSGKLLDVRFGVLGELPGQKTYEVLLLHTKFDMTHEVYNPVWPVFMGNPSIMTQVAETEINRDKTNTWGLHLGYRQPVGNRDWKIGTIFTANYKTHPKIPNYQIMNIPRDPGNSRAFNLGVGFSRHHENATFGLDLIYQPIWSNTWATAQEKIETAGGWIIYPGERTIDNDFKFSNSILRIGIQRENQRTGFQLGLQVYTYRYRLKQRDYIQSTSRKQRESWSEWTPSFSFILKFPEVRLQYTLRFTSGAGRPGVAQPWFGIREMSASNADFIVAPGGPLTLQNSTVFTHQLTVSVPIGDSAKNHR